MNTPPSYAYHLGNPSCVEPSRQAERVYRTVTLAAMLLILASLWAF